MGFCKQSDDVRRVLVIGDNHISRSIIRALGALGVHVCQVIAGPIHSDSIDGVYIYRSDFSSDSLKALFRTIAPDLLTSTTAGGLFETQKRIIDLAIQAGIRKFIAPEFSHDSLNTEVQGRLPRSKERFGFQWAAVATGCTLDRGLSSGDLRFDLKWQSATIHGAGDEAFAASSCAWIGRVVLSMMEHWEAIQGQYIYAAGTLTNMNEVISCLEESSGKRWEVGRGDVEDCIREGESAGMFLIQRSVLYDSSTEAVRSFRMADAKGVLELDCERVRDIIDSARLESEKQGKGDCGCL
ncbi:hypothetical protein K431DRAFT_339061 [Polychaeton citri CBS 116435]|uniref:NmrA-like domain-containing protein n=1 Tax=Polychaeton citri CBS 116435 TaxID=1314669 RepID=A0A9P4UMA6_9PEZI|nr:hypothetical protein K431DRAFT_339061 [Polychaeton citri CBS 116435]